MTSTVPAAASWKAQTEAVEDADGFSAGEAAWTGLSVIGLLMLIAVAGLLIAQG